MFVVVCPQMHISHEEMFVKSTANDRRRCCSLAAQFVYTVLTCCTVSDFDVTCLSSRFCVVQFVWFGIIIKGVSFDVLMYASCHQLRGS